jgi:metal-sulfur cluster biosynthetic enzyme
MILAGRKHQFDRIAQSVDERMNMVENAVASVAGVGEVKVNIVWEPPWDPSRMSDEARAVLNMW